MEYPCKIIREVRSQPSLQWSVSLYMPKMKLSIAKFPLSEHNYWGKKQILG